MKEFKKAIRRALSPAAQWVLKAELKALRMSPGSELRYRTLDGVMPVDDVPDPLPDEFKNVRLGSRALYKLVSDFAFETVLDIGCGEGRHAAVLANHGKTVTALDYGKSPYYHWRNGTVDVVIGDFNTMELSDQYDCAWASHVLEHQLNPHHFLRRMHAAVKEGGLVAITVPPLKHRIVGGHVALWNAGLLLYHLVHAGFDCSEVHILQYGYNISVIVRKKTVGPIGFVYDMGDIRTIREYLPRSLVYRSEELDDSFDGNIHRLNW